MSTPPDTGFGAGAGLGADAGAGAGAGVLCLPTPLPARSPSPTPVSRGGAGNSDDSHDPGAMLAAFLARVRQRIVWYDLTDALRNAAGAAAIVGVLAGGLSESPHLPSSMSPTLVLLLAFAAAAIAAALTLTGRASRWRDRALIDLVEASHPACANTLVTAHELLRETVDDRYTTNARVKPYIRARVLDDATRAVRDVDPTTWLPWRNGAGSISTALIFFVIAAVTMNDAITRWQSAARPADAAAGLAATGRAANATPLLPPVIRHVDIDVIPPAYTGLPATSARDPERLDVLAGSRLRVRIDATADEINLQLEGMPSQTITSTANADNANNAGGVGSAPKANFARDLTPVQSGVLAIGARTRGLDGEGDPNNAGHAASHRLIALTLTPDQPPVVAITAPGHDLMASDVEQRVRFVVHATDDYGLNTLTLHYTKVSGSGERFEFKEAELPLAIARGSARNWEGAVERSLRDLHVDIGDTIVYYAVATDRRPGQERAVSDSYVIEIAQTGAAIAGGFAVPKDEDVFAISLNALIQKTEKLHGRRASMPDAEFASASAGLAIEQRMVRSEFLFSMGTHGRVEDEEEEAENSNEIQEGRLQNKGQSELTQAVDLMTLAERHLTNADTGDALKAQRGALAAVQKAQSRQRYFLRTIPIKSRIDQTRRLTGNLTDAASSQHPAPAGSPDTQAAALRALLDDCARLSAMLSPDRDASADAREATAGSAASTTAGSGIREDAAGRGAVPARANGLASSIGARMMALDPTSTPLHAAASSLLQVAPLAARGRRDEARGLVRAAATLLVPLAQRANAATAGAGVGAPRNGDGGNANGGAHNGANSGGAANDPALRGAIVDALRRTARPGDVSRTAGEPR